MLGSISNLGLVPVEEGEGWTGRLAVEEEDDDVFLTFRLTRGLELRVLPFLILSCLQRIETEGRLERGGCLCIDWTDDKECSREREGEVLKYLEVKIAVVLLF